MLASQFNENVHNNRLCNPTSNAKQAPYQLSAFMWKKLKKLGGMVAGKGDKAEMRGLLHSIHGPHASRAAW